MRNQGLDLVRAISVLLVLNSHWKDAWASEPTHPALYQIFYYGGNYGVHLFFVLSGFLVGGILLREWSKTGRVRPWNFLLRRGIRIYPLFYIGLLIAVFARGNLNELNWRNPIYDAFYIPLEGVRSHYWTLKVEEHFYAFSALVFWAASALSGKSFYWTVGIVFATIPFIQMTLRATLRWLNEADYTSRIILHSYGSIAAGVLLALAQSAAPVGFAQVATKYRWWIAIPSLIAYLAHRYVPRSDTGKDVSMGYELFDRTLNRFMQTVLAAAVVYGFYGFEYLPFFWKPVLWIGFYSYAIYLFHIDIKGLLEGLRKKVSDPDKRGNVAVEFFIFLFYLVASIGIGGLAGMLNQWVGDWLIAKYA